MAHAGFFLEKFCGDFMDQNIRKRPVPLKEEEQRNPKLFNHFETEEQWAQHLEEVARIQNEGEVPF